MATELWHDGYDVDDASSSRGGSSSPLYGVEDKSGVSGRLSCKVNLAPFTKFVWDDIMEEAASGTSTISTRTAHRESFFFLLRASC